MKFSWKTMKPYVISFIAVLGSALLYSITIRFFIKNQNSQILTGGVSGISLMLSRLMYYTDYAMQLKAYSYLYILLNIPIFILGYVSIGKRFAIFTLINVMLVSYFVSAMPIEIVHLIEPELQFVEPIALALFAGALSGMSTSIALLGNTSGGGTDVIAVYFGLKKGVQIGRYLFILNAMILISGALIFGEWVQMMYSVLYIYTSSLVIDSLHIRNKKELLHIVTTRGEELSNFLVSHSLHGCTIIDAKGAFTHSAKQILLVAVSTFEVKHFMEMIRNIDPESFTMVTSVDTVYGKFYMPPIG